MANYHVGITLKAAGHYDEAILFFNKLLEKSDDHVSALYHLGRTYIKNFRYEKAKECFRKALEIDPENKNAREIYEFLINA